MSEPWDAAYMTIDEAAIAALDAIFPASRNAKKEYGVAIFQDPRTTLYGYTDFVTDNKIASVKNLASGGAGFVALGHTHPSKPSEGYLPHHVSNHAHANSGYPCYWIAPNGTVHVYEPSLGKRRMVRRHHGNPQIVR